MRLTGLWVRAVDFARLPCADRRSDWREGRRSDRISLADKVRGSGGLNRRMSAPYRDWQEVRPVGLVLDSVRALEEFRQLSGVCGR